MRFVSGSKKQAPGNRAEEARRRRSERSEERVSSVTRRITNQARTRQVISRGNLFGSPIHQQASTRNARRAFYVTIDQRGSELRLPALPVVHVGWRLASGLIAILALVGMYYFLNSPYFEIPVVDVQGLQRIPPEEISFELDLENRSIIEVDRDEVLAILTQKYTELINIKVSVEMPNIVSISASERQPVLAWRQGDQTQWVDAEGFIFPSRGDAGPLVTIQSENSLPLEPFSPDQMARMATIQASPEDDVTEEEQQPKPGILESLLNPGEQEIQANDTRVKADLTLLDAAQGLSQKLPPETHLVYTEANGLGWTEPQGWQVYIGKDLDQFEVKYALYQTVASYLADQGVQPVLISVEHLNAPFYRLEQ